MGWRGVPAAPGAYGSRAGNQSQGYYLGYGPTNAGSGSGMGVQMAGMSSLAQGAGVNVAGQQWHPTVLYLAALVVVEMVVFGWISHILR